MILGGVGCFRHSSQTGSTVEILCNHYTLNITQSYTWICTHLGPSLPAPLLNSKHLLEHLHIVYTLKVAV